MMDSPYVRRVAVSLRLLGVPHEHEQVSVFRHLERFRALNPLVKAPTLILDDGMVLTDSTLILEAVESLAGRSLMPAGPGARMRALRIVGIALVAMEKSVHLYYETGRRPPECRWPEWSERLRGQMLEAWHVLEGEASAAAPWLIDNALTQADVSLAVAWRFAHFIQPGTLDANAYPALRAYCARVEALPEFTACPLE